MKFKIEIELDDLISDMNEDGDCDLNAYVKDEIIRSTSRAVLNVVQKRVDESILKKVSEIADSMVESVVDKALTKAISGGVLKLHGRETTIDEYVMSQFSSHSSWNSPEAYLGKKAKEFSADMKNRVDAIFATKIVMNMKDQGLLKAGVADMLIGKE